MSTTIAPGIGLPVFGFWATPFIGIEFQMGYVRRRLPSDYVGERHLVTVSRLPNGHYEWEERPGPGPVKDESDCGTIIQVVFVAAPEQQQSAAQHDDATGREISAGAPDSTRAARDVADIIRNSDWVRPAPSGPKSRLVMNSGLWQ